MTKPKNGGKAWSSSDIQEMKTRAKHNTPTGLIAYDLGRTKSSVQNKASELKVSLKPTNQSPYNRRPK